MPKILFQQPANAVAVFAQTIEIAPGVFAGVLADNGGPTQTVALKLDPSNPAIGGADPATATATDQRGVARDADPDIGAFEVNEAFAVVAMAFQKEFDLSPDVVNVHGGACALGHPIGCSGTRIVVTLLAALANHGKKRGIASLCIGGGEATALAVELI